MDAVTEVGARGQFDVLADGEVIASKSSDLLPRLLGGGWPDEGAVVEELGRRLGR